MTANLSFNIDFKIYNQLPVLAEIQKLQEAMDALRPLTRDQEYKIMQKFRLDWNYHSNSIEGNTLNYGETVAFLMHGLTAKGKPLKDHLDLRGHNEGIKFLYDLIKAGGAIREKDIRDLHKIILVEPYQTKTTDHEGNQSFKTINIGQYKTTPNYVITKTGEEHHYATPEETPILMGELMKFYEKALEDDAVHPVLLAAYFHFAFVAIHPFDDGNGRLARLLMNLILLKAGYPPVVIQSSKEDRVKYYGALSEADAGSMQSFFELIADGMVRSLEIQLKGARGESMDEPSDFDKKLVLLKMELEEKNVKVQKDEEVLKSLYLNIFRPLIEKTDILMDKISDLFFESFYEWSYQNSVSDEFDALELGDVFFEYGNNSITKLFGDENNIYAYDDEKFFFKWEINDLKYKPSIGYEIILYLKLEKYTYSIEGAISGDRGIVFSLEKEYPQSISEKEQSALVDQLGNAILEQIKKDSNPA